jgi:hypothetical protein
VGTNSGLDRWSRPSLTLGLFLYRMMDGRRNNILYIIIQLSGKPDTQLLIVICTSLSCSQNFQVLHPVAPRSDS